MRIRKESGDLWKDREALEVTGHGCQGLVEGWSCAISLPAWLISVWLLCDNLLRWIFLYCVFLYINVNFTKRLKRKSSIYTPHTQRQAAHFIP